MTTTVVAGRCAARNVTTGDKTTRANAVAASRQEYIVSCPLGGCSRVSPSDRSDTSAALLFLLSIGYSDDGCVTMTTAR